MLVEETLAIVQQAPLAHDAATATHDAAQSAIGQVHIVATYAGMDGKVIHTLLALLYERVAIYLPREVFDLAINLFEGLVDGNRAHGYWTIAKNPLACFGDIVASGEVHQRVASPLARPHGFVHFFIYR